MTDSTSSSRDRCIDRRTLLASLGAGAVGISGCLSSPFDSDPASEPSAPSESDVLGEISMGGKDLVINLRADSQVDSVDLVGPDGELYGTHPTKPETTRISFQLLGETEDGYISGEYRVVAISEADPVDESTISLEPELKITDLLWARNNPEMEWDKSETTWQDHAALVIKNTGSGPSFLKTVQWSNAPICLVKSRETIQFHHSVMLPAGETTTVHSPAAIYQTEGLGFGKALDCGELDTDQFSVTAIVQTDENPSHSQKIHYGGEIYDCKLSIVDKDTSHPPANGGDD